MGEKEVSDIREAIYRFNDSMSANLIIFYFAGNPITELQIDLHRDARYWELTPKLDEYVTKINKINEFTLAKYFMEAFKEVFINIKVPIIINETAKIEIMNTTTYVVYIGNMSIVYKF